MLINHGGSSILSETTEIYGAEHLLINRANLDIFNPKIFPKIKHLVDLKGVMLLKDMEKVKINF